MKSDDVPRSDRGPVLVTVVCDQGRDYREDVRQAEFTQVVGKSCYAKVFLTRLFCSCTTCQRAIKMVDRAIAASCALRKLGSKVRMWAITYGLENTSLARLRNASFLIHDFSHVHPVHFALSPLTQEQRDLQFKGVSTPEPYRRQPQSLGSHSYQSRRDYVCTSAKFFAWNLTAHSNVLMVDADVILQEDPLPWMLQYKSELFMAEAEKALRTYIGLNTRIMYLQPSGAIFEMLRRASISGNFLPYTTSEQDVIESVLTSPNGVVFPRSVHTKNMTKYDDCVKMTHRIAH